MKKLQIGQLSAVRGLAIIGASLATVAILAASAPAEAADDGSSDLAIAAKLGANWSTMNPPNDPRGEPTLLSGSAFDGFGFTGGIAGFYQLAELQGASFELEAGLLYSYHSGSGFEEIPGGEKRTLTLSTQMVQVPIMVHLKSGNNAGGFRVGVGLVPMLGLQSAATVELENSTRTPEPLETQPAIHLGLSAALGYDFAIDPTYSVPLEVRVAWDPAVGESTRDRFPDYASMSDPGAYQVAYNWQLLFMTGLRYEL